MQIEEARDRLSLDIKDFLTFYELAQNNSEKHFKALIDVKLEMIKILAYDLRKINPGIPES